MTLLATGPLALVAHQFAPYATYADVVRAARREPGALRYATSGACCPPARCCWRRRTP